MKIYLICNNSLLDGISYQNGTDLELVRLLRPLSIKGEENAKIICKNKELENVDKIYSSFHSSALSTAKYLGLKLDLKINMNDKLNDCRVGMLGNKNMKMIKGLQDHDFNYKLTNGESLTDVGGRLETEVNKIIIKEENAAVFTHKRAILGFLLKYSKVGYNLDDSLILECNNKQIYDDTDSLYDIYELVIEDKKIIDINLL